jgi:hypothetical protein
MNDTDRKFLTEWGGEKCVLLDDGKYYSGLSVAGEPLPIRTFDTWEDFGWLHENMMGKPYDIAFSEYIHGTKGYTMDEWWTLTVAERCQLICDFLRERET